MLSRLVVRPETEIQSTANSLHIDLERRVTGAPPGLCPLDLASSYLKVYSA